jgi:hypothetical protein
MGGSSRRDSWVITLKLASVQGRTSHDRDVGGVVSARQQDVANPRLVVAGIERDNILQRAQPEVRLSLNGRFELSLLYRRYWGG